MTQQAELKIRPAKRFSKGASPTRADRARIADLAERYLEPHQPKGFRLVVDRDSVRLQDDVWTVVVNPDHDDVRSYDYHGRAVEAAMDMEEGEGLWVLFLPMLPPDGD